MGIEYDLLEPSKLYNQLGLKNSHHETVTTYFDQLVKDKTIDVEANHITVKNYNENSLLYKAFDKKIKAHKFWSNFLLITSIFMASIGIILACVGVEAISVNPIIFIIGLIGAILGITGIVSYFTALKKRLIKLKERCDYYSKLMDKYLQEGYAQLDPLNNAYEWNIAAKLFSKTMPIVQMDETFLPERFMELNQKYGFLERGDINRSTVFVQSGTILENPFVILKEKVMEMKDHVYVGSVTIHWTTTTHDKNGTHVHHHSQTLTAELTKPRPEYSYETTLVYANGAAPDLSFYRLPTKVNSMNEKELEKYDKKLQDLAEDAIKKGESFTPLGNTKFEALFNCTNRDNEIQYRLLFTPLAQKNFINLLSTKEPYGDDFYFTKSKCLNFISSKHTQGFPFAYDNTPFYTYDIDQARDKFVDYCEEYFKVVFYDFAPLLSIPLYQQYKPSAMTMNPYYANNTSFEIEVMANEFGIENFRPEHSTTDIILKSKYLNKVGQMDKVNIEAHSFYSESRITTFTKMGGDGHLHEIPVYWDEYFDVSSDNEFVVSNTKNNKNDYDEKRKSNDYSSFSSSYAKFNSIIASRGLLGFLSNPNLDKSASERLEKIFLKKEENINE